MATTLSKTFGAVGFGNGLAIKNGDKFTYSVSGTFVGTVRLTESIDGGASWSPTGVSATGSASGTYFAKLRSASSALYRWECTAYTSGAIVTSLVDADIHLQEWYSNDGILAGYVDETGFNGGTLVSGAGFADGLVGTPSFAYVLDTDTGFYRIGDGNFAATCNGTKSAEFKSSGILVPDGSSSAPSYSFTSEPTAGLFRDAAGSCEWVSADTSNTRFRVDSTSLTANAGFLASTASGSSGDAYIRFIEISSASDQWIMGRDDSASGAFKLSQGAALGTNDFLSCTTAGAWTLGTGTSAVHSMNGSRINFTGSNSFDLAGQSNNAGRLYLCGASSSANGAIIGVFGNSHATNANQTKFYNAGSETGGIDAAGAWTIGASGQNHIITGNSLQPASDLGTDLGATAKRYATAFASRLSSGASTLNLNTNSTDWLTITTAGVLTHTGGFSLTKYMSTTRLDVASAATITALASTNSLVKLTGATATALQGITAGVDGQRLTLVNLTGANLNVQHENAGATAANRITTMTGADIATTGNGTAEFIYDTGSSRWICLDVTA